MGEQGGVADSCGGSSSVQRPAAAIPGTVRVAILLCTMSGERYLAAQLESIAHQTHTNWFVVASDDGSTDGTYALLERYQGVWGSDRLLLRTGPGGQLAANFLSLVGHCAIQADYYAYADQDDIWEPDKLVRALDWLTTIPADSLALYCSRTRLIDTNNHDIGFSPLFTKPPSFANALVQNIGGGNTMVFNDATCRRLRAAAKKVPQVVMHDWWTYMVVAGCGGQVYYDVFPTVRYRQHEGNLMGSNVSWAARWARARLLLKGCFRRWNTCNTQALQYIRYELTVPNQRVLDDFCRARHQSLLPRLMGMKRCGIYRQTLLGNVGLIVAVLFNRV